MKSSITGYKIYKPTKAKTGGALQLNIAESMRCAFFEVASQNKDAGADDEKSFDWTRKIVMKLGFNDMLLLIDALSIVRDLKHKEMMRAGPESYDTWLDSLCTSGKSGASGDKFVTNIAHFNNEKGTVTSLAIKPNSAKYGGGFRFCFFKKTTEASFSHTVSVNPIEALGLIYTLEKCIMLTDLVAPATDDFQK